MHSDNPHALLTMRLFGLFLKCPFGEATDDCPFADIRALRSLELKFQLAEQMAGNPGCQANVRNTHETCYRKRLQLLREQQPPCATPAMRMKPAPPCSQPNIGLQ